MAKLRIGRPVWLARRGRPSRTYPILRGETTADVVVIGGGVTGAAVAWRFSEAGLRVVVLEAARVGAGSTGASTALLMQEPDDDFRELTRRYGRRATRRIWQLSELATREFVRTLRRLAIPCDLVPCDSVYVATERDAGKHLMAKHAGHSLVDEHHVPA